MEYKVWYQSKIVGAAQIEKQGMFYLIHCRCTLPEKGNYRLFVEGGSITENLGILIPNKQGYEVRSRIAINKIGQGELTFAIRKNDTESSDKFYPVCENEIFSAIDQLDKGRLAVHEDRLGIVIRE